MAVEEIDLDPPAPELESLFRAYHAWNKEQVLETLGDGPLPAEAIEADYDVDSIIQDDLAYLADPTADGRLFVARGDDGLDGCVFLQWRSAAQAEVKRLYVRPAARGRGLGRRLMEELIETVRASGCRSLVLHTGSYTAAAQALYDDLGFEPTTSFECEVPPAAHDDWLFMRLELDGPSS